MKSITKIFAALLVTSMIAGCSGLTPAQQRMLSGGAIGVGAGAAVGVLSGGSAAAGAVLGGAAGVVGGLLYDQSRKNTGW